MITSNLTYQSITAISQTPLFIVLGILFVFVPIIFTIIIASLIHARSGDKTYKKRMVSSPALWLSIGLWILFQGLFLIFGFYFPFWINLI